MCVKSVTYAPHYVLLTTKVDIFIKPTNKRRYFLCPLTVYCEKNINLADEN